MIFGTAPDELCLRAYTYALNSSRFLDSEIARHLAVDSETVERIRLRLIELRLLVPAGTHDSWATVDPEVAEIELRLPVEEEILRKRKENAQIHQNLSPFASIYGELSRSRHGSSIRILENPSDVRNEISEMMLNCTKELVTMQPGGGRNAETIQNVLQPTLEMLERGVCLRTLYQHTARANLATRNFARRVVELGAEVRTTGEVFERLIIFDGEVAFVPAPRSGRKPPGAAIVTDPIIVGFAYRTFEGVWQSAQAYETDRHEYQHTAQELSGRILHLMAAGLKDDAIARRLGMATRTCRRYVTEIMRDLGAVSRFQAGVKASRMGLLDEEDAPGTQVELVDSDS